MAYFKTYDCRFGAGFTDLHWYCKPDLSKLRWGEGQAQTGRLMSPQEVGGVQGTASGVCREVGRVQGWLARSGGASGVCGGGAWQDWKGLAGQRGA